MNKIHAFLRETEEVSRLVRPTQAADIMAALNVV